MQAVFVHDRLDFGEIDDLMDQRCGILALEGVSAIPAGTGLAVAPGAELLGRNQAAERLGMAGLTAAAALRRRCRWLAFDADGIGGGGLGGVGGVELEPGLQIADALLQFPDPLLEGVQEGQEGRLSFRWHGVPERFGDRRLRNHDKDTTKLLYERFGL
jgi:hypothetical protein